MSLLRGLVTAPFRLARYLGSAAAKGTCTLGAMAANGAVTATKAVARRAFHAVNYYANTSSIFDPVIFHLRLDDYKRAKLKEELEELERTYNAHLSPQTKTLIGELTAFLENDATTLQSLKEKKTALIRALRDDNLRTSGSFFKDEITKKQVVDQLPINEKPPEVDPAQIEQKFKAETAALGNNIRDFLTFKLISSYILKLEDKDFATIKTSEKSTNNPEYFTTELRRKIRESNLGFFTKHGTLLFLPLIQYVIGRYSKDVIVSIANHLSSTIASVDKEELLQRGDHAIRKYTNLILTWLQSPTAGSKEVFIKEHGKDETYLEFNGYATNEASLFDEFSKKAVDKYFDLYNGPSNRTGPLTSLAIIEEAISRVVRAPVMTNRRSNLGKLLNGGAIFLKWLALTVPTKFTFGVIKLPLKLFETTTNYIVKKFIKKYLKSNDLLKSLADESIKGIYDPKAYVSVINTFLLDQLKILSVKLQTILYDDGRDSEDEVLLISEVQRTETQTFLKDLLTLLEKDEFDTKEEANASDASNFNESHLTQSSRSLIKKGILTYLNANKGSIKNDAINSLITVFFKLYNDLTSEEFLRTPLTKLFEQLNNLLISPKDNAPNFDDLHRSQQQNLQDQHMQILNTLSSLIIKDKSKTADQAALETYNKRLLSLQKKMREGGLWHNLLQEMTNTDFSDTSQDLDIKIDKLSKAIVFFRSEKQILETDKETLREFSTPLLGHLDHLINSLEGVHDSLATCKKNHADLPYLNLLENLFQNLPRAPAAPAVEIVFNDQIFETLEKHLRAILSKTIKLESNASDNPLFTDLRWFETLKEHYQTLKKGKKELDQLKLLQSIKSETDNHLLTDLVALINEKIDAQSSWFGSFSKNKELEKLKNEILSEIPPMGELEPLKELFKKLASSKTTDNLARVLADIKAFDLRSIADAKQRQFDEKLASFVTLSAEKQIVITRLKDGLTTNNGEMTTLIAERISQITTKKEEITTLLQQQLPKKIKVDHSSPSQAISDAGYANAVRVGAEAMMKRYTNGIFKLSRNGNFARFMVYHLLMIPFVQKKDK